MAEGDFTHYNEFYFQLGQGTYDLSSGGSTIKVALLSPSYTPNIDTHVDFTDLTNEIVATGYTAGGATLAGQSYTKDNTNDQAVFDATDLTWTSLATATIGYAVLYIDAATDYLIGYIEISTNSNGSDYKLEWPSGGIFVINQGA